MSAADRPSPPSAQLDRLRRQLVVVAALVTLLALLHHADHVIRGDLVLTYGLEGRWNHSGWPFQAPVTPFTASLAVYLLLVPGIVFTLRRRLWAGYWLGASLVLLGVIVVVHFLPGRDSESPQVIFASYRDSTGSLVSGALALVDVFTLVASLLLLLALAIRARRVSGHW